MKTANKNTLLTFRVLAGVMFAIALSSSAAMAMPPGDALANSAPMIVPPASSPASPVTAPAPMAVPPMPSGASLVHTESAKSSSLSADVDKNISGAEQRATDNAKNVLKRLDTIGDQATFEDLNTAKQAVVRLDAMIDVEKRLSELEKARSDRGGSHSLASAIPASALAPPPPAVAAHPVVTPVVEVEEPVKKPRVSLSTMEVERIIGVDGKYAAVLKTSSGTKTVRVGDQVGDDGVVRWISSSSVSVEENGVTHNLHIKNVDAIFSAAR